MATKKELEIAELKGVFSREGEQFLSQEQYRRALEAQATGGITKERIKAGYKNIEAKTGAFQAKLAGISTTMTMVNWLKPFLVGALIFLFFIGPGLSSIIIILGSMPWYLWLGAMVVGILMWRNR